MEVSKQGQRRNCLGRILLDMPMPSIIKTVSDRGTAYAPPATRTRRRMEARRSGYSSGSRKLTFYLSECKPAQSGSAQIATRFEERCAK